MRKIVSVQDCLNAAENYRFVMNYRDEEALFQSFCGLAFRTFGIKFKEWKENGYWKECYLPYSIADGEKIVANISVNLMEFDCKGERRHYIQLGTVMTDEAYRGQGLSRYLMERILEEYEGRCDGIYLFANDRVLDFYPKFGFRKCREYQCVKSITSSGCGPVRKAVPVDMDSKAGRGAFEDALRNGACSSAFGMRENDGLVMFYASMSMKHCIYYIEGVNGYAVAEIEGDTLYLHDVFTPKPADPDQIIAAFGSQVKKVRLGFTPLSAEGYEKVEYREEDTTLFVKGSGFDSFEQEEKMFPLLSYA